MIEVTTSTANKGWNTKEQLRKTGMKNRLLDGPMHSTIVCMHRYMALIFPVEL